MSLSQDMQMTVKNRQLHAKVWGPVDGCPVIALHGWLDNAASFDVIAGYLPKVRLVALDLAGHGLSQHRSIEAGYELWNDMADVIAVADQLGWEQFGLLGHSRGAITAMLLAGTFPERVTHLGLIDCIFPDVLAAEEAPVQLSRAICADKRVPSKPIPVYTSLAAASRVRQFGMVKVSREVARRLVARGTKAVEGGYSWITDPRLLQPSPWKFTEQQLHAFMARIQISVPLIVASRGLALWSDTWREQLRRYPCIVIYEMEGSHHLHMEDASQAIAAIMHEYYSQRA